MRKEQEVTMDDSDEKVTIYVVKPNNDIIAHADMLRAKRWNECIQDGIITKKELTVLMEKRGIWDKEKSTKEDGITKQIQELEKNLFRGEKGKKPKVSEGKDIAIEMKDLRARLRELIGERLALEENTAESLSDNVRFDYFVAMCTFYKDTNEKVYISMEDYNNRSSDAVAFAAASMLGDILYNLDPSFEENLPENRWLRGFDLINQDFGLVNTEGDLVDRRGNKINDLGHYLDDNDNRVDVDGIPLNDDGSYVMVEYENDLGTGKPKPKPKRRKSTKKVETVETPETSTTES
jgi:hypothetical protein